MILDTLRLLLGPSFFPFLGGMSMVGLTGMAAGAALNRRERLAAITSLALQRADITQDYVHHTTQTPRSKLSEQLGGKRPFTALYRLFESEEIERQTDFVREWLALMADTYGLAIVPKDWSALLVKVDQVLSVRRSRMAKAGLVSVREETA